MSLTLNGTAVSSLKLTLPRIGAWHADVVCDSSTPLTGSVELVVDGELTMTGTVVRGDTPTGALRTRIVGGANGLRAMVKPRDYHQPAFTTVMRDVLSDAGEKASPTIASAVLTRQMAHWTTLAMPAGQALRNLVELGAPGMSWRHLPDGTVWVGAEAWTPWPEALAETEVMAEDGVSVFGLEYPYLLPGYTIDDRKIDVVELTAEGGKVRARVWWVDE